MRLFIATTFPAEVLRDLNDRIATLRPRLPPASWVRPETQHLTFAFLGEQDPSVVDRIAIDPGSSFEGLLAGCGFFSKRVGWVGIEPRDVFNAVADRVRAGLNAAKVEFDPKPFKPHLTLLRIRDSWPPRSIETFRSALGDYRSAPFAIPDVTLFSSQLNPRGAIHTPLRKFRLAA